MARTPVYILFAGADGAGKSTLNASGLWKDNRFPKKTLKVIPEEFLAGSGGDIVSKEDMQAAEAKARALADSYIDTRKSLCQETSLVEDPLDAQIAHAREQGYRVYMFYVGCANGEIAGRRSKQDNPMEECQRNFLSSVSNLSHAVSLCDEVCVFDNTQQLTSLAVWENGSLSWWGGVRADKSWLAEAIRNREVWRAGAA